MSLPTYCNPIIIGIIDNITDGNKNKLEINIFFNNIFILLLKLRVIVTILTKIIFNTKFVRLTIENRLNTKIPTKYIFLLYL
jgi:hypothetical protein